jgi:hypothetical protein
MSTAALTATPTADPAPWVHVSGQRVTSPGAKGVPQGGYTFLPRPGYSDYEGRFISTRFGEHSSYASDTNND